MRVIFLFTVLLLIPFVSAELIGSHASEDGPCISDNKRCKDNVFQQCTNGSWTIIEECAFTERCDRTNGCELRTMAMKGPGQNAIQALQNEPYVQKFIPISEENKTIGIKPMPRINLPVAENVSIMQSTDENTAIIITNDSLPEIEEPVIVEKKVVVQKTFSVKEIPLIKKTSGLIIILAYWFGIKL